MKKGNRVSIKFSNPNPLFTTWLTEWRDEALEKNSKLYNTFNIALKSLSKYPLPLDNGRDCLILKGFGKKLCQMLDQKLKSLHSDTVCNRKKPAYVPTYRSGAYAILLTLYKHSLEPKCQTSLTKVEIIEHGQLLCDTSFTKSNPGTFYTAWSSMKTLLNNSLVIKNNSPAKYSLTEKGKLLAMKMNNFEDKKESKKVGECSKSLPQKEVPKEITVRTDLCSSQSSSVNKCVLTAPIVEKQKNKNPRTNCSAEFETFFFLPQSYDVLLLVDCNETLGAMNVENDPVITGLASLNVNNEVRHLKVGDFAWICREKNNKKELLLPYIVERKRMDDLAKSVKDGRFHEQKFRLRQCGVENVIYLIENYGTGGGATHLGLPLSSLYQASVNTLIQDNFSVKYTEGTRGTLEYLASMTKLLIKLFDNKTLMNCPKDNITKLNYNDDLLPLLEFQEFNKGAAKKRVSTVKERFICQLLQIKGMSVEKALAITNRYPTVKHLMTAYDNCEQDCREKLLSTLQFGKLNRSIGPVLSKIVSSLYTSSTFP